MITRLKPKLDYNGLTVILSNPSRFDLKQNKLLASTGGTYFNECLQPHFNRFQCDIRTVECKDEFLSGTKCLLLLGETALHKIAKCGTTINEQRGSPLIHSETNVPIISSYSAQDAVEVRNLENEFNPYLIQQGIEDDESEDNDSSGVSEKLHHGKTSRKNYRFWFARDIEKAIKIVKNNGQLPKDYEHEPSYILYPDSNTINRILRTTKSRLLYFDIETDTQRNITVFSFAFDYSAIYIVPVIDHTYNHAYPCLPAIFASLAIAIRDNILVAHNGSGFDYLVLAHKYRIAIKNVYDTMLAQNRCLIGESIVDTVSGQFQIKDLVGKENFHVWSWKDGKPFPAKVKWVAKTGENKQLVRVKLWRRKFGGTEIVNIDCTPDHKFLIEGQWIEAKDLKQGYRLTRCNLVFTNDYCFINHRKLNEKAHRYIWECLNRKLEVWEDIHHIDESRTNNEPDNLKPISHSKHLSQHRNGQLAEGLKRHIEQNGVWNKGTGFVDKITKEKLQELYDSKMSQKDIAKIFNTDASVISRAMKKHSITTRDLKSAQQIRRQNETNCKVISVEYLEQKQDVYCMEVEGTNCFSCNDVIVHNCYPEAEKSLGHSLSLPWLFQPYHKDEGSFAYGNQQQALQLWRYCGKDVSSLMLLKQAQDTYAKSHIGLRSSIDSVNSYVRSYVTTTLLGIRYSQETMEKTMSDNDRIMNQILRLVTILIGEKYIKIIRGTGKSAMPNSNKQCVAYFHGLLKYPVVGTTPDGNPSLGKKYMFKLKLKMNNPVIDLVILYRRLAKASGSLKFIPFKQEPTKELT